MDRKKLYNELMCEALSYTNDDMTINRLSKLVKRDLNEGEMFGSISNKIKKMFSKHNNNSDENNGTPTNPIWNAIRKRGENKKEKLNPKTALDELSMEFVLDANNQLENSEKYAVLNLSDYRNKRFNIDGISVVRNVFYGFEEKGYVAYIGICMTDLPIFDLNDGDFFYIVSEDDDIFDGGCVDVTDSANVVLCDVRSFLRNIGNGIYDAITNSLIGGYPNDEDNFQSWLAKHNIKSTSLSKPTNQHNKIQEILNGLKDKNYYFPNWGLWTNNDLSKMQSVVKLLYVDLKSNKIHLVKYKFKISTQNIKTGDSVYVFVKDGEYRNTGNIMLDDESKTTYSVYKQ